MPIPCPLLFETTSTGHPTAADAAPTINLFDESNVNKLPLVATLLPFRYSTPLAVPPLSVTVEEVVSVVNAPVDALLAPMLVASIVPPLMSIVVTAPPFETVAPLKDTVPDAVRLVNVPAAAEFAPMVVPSMLPLLISTFVTPAVIPAPTSALAVIFFVSVALVSTIGSTSVDAATSPWASDVSALIFLSAMRYLHPFIHPPREGTGRRCGFCGCTVTCVSVTGSTLRFGNIIGPLRPMNAA